MGAYVGPDIVEDGLVFYVDAANPLSYPGSGTTYFDLKNDNNGTFSSTPTFDPSEGQGVIDFDGTDYIGFGTNVFTNYLSGATQFTFGYWCKKDTSSSGMMAGSWEHNNRDGFFLQWHTNGRLYFGVSNGGTSSNNVLLPWANRYFYLTGVFDGSLSNNSRGKIYVDGILTSFTAATNITSFTTDVSELQIGSLQNYSNYSDGKIGPAQLYNRALSSEEVLQNYNALKPRFIN